MEIHRSNVLSKLIYDKIRNDTRVSYMTENDDKYIEDILSKENPYVCKSVI